ncbi:uncharacterized protein KQ657_002187 [Scheffersomyces spartinae]|uniref:TLC domain-containing protein n=1 Tax=Scheffersomyces spartinae TaxID=45513 RepID=A0A9P7VDI4_9ASCO|nr:uncharacterized protein KQ657_002187 [Scheffersomyces spartinae]KAG7195802.1 hypothetical protein KQ657_002187 [Scheffersomyces spartinae]
MSFLPVFERDPFLGLNPYPWDSPLGRHWHEIAASTLMYFILQSLLSTYTPIYVGKPYLDLNRKTRINFDIHVVSMVQCILSCAMIIPMWGQSHWQNRTEDPVSSILGTTDYGNLVASLTIGYFIWDTYVCLRYFLLFGFGFLFHGIAALYVFVLCLWWPFCQPWIPGFLIFEASTPFVNINWFASRLPKGTISGTVTVINGILLMLTFFLVRIIWGFYSVALVATDMWKTWSYHAWWIPSSVLAINVFLDVLNVFWFTRMIQIAKKQARAKRD